MNNRLYVLRNQMLALEHAHNTVNRTKEYLQEDGARWVQHQRLAMAEEQLGLALVEARNVYHNALERSKKESTPETEKTVPHWLREWVQLIWTGKK